MPTVLKITFQHPNGDSNLAQQNALERAHHIADYPGLLWKIWITDASQSLYGGIYLFADAESAHAYLASPIVEGIRAIPGLSRFDAQLFDVNAPLSTITRGPISRSPLTGDE
jgi:hypothetical protein